MRRFALLSLLVLLAGCGGASPPPVSGSPSERLWAEQARGLLEGLDDALPRITRAGVGPATLTDTSHLYEALLGYTYVASCGDQLAHLGPPSPRERDAAALLRRACDHLRHASTLFTRAVQLGRSPILVGAATEALGTATLLREARAELKGL